MTPMFEAVPLPFFGAVSIKMNLGNRGIKV